MLDVNLLNESFNRYLEQAGKYRAQKNVSMAKRFYMLAAQKMMELARESKGELQKAQMERARRLVELAETAESGILETNPECGHSEGRFKNSEKKDETLTDWKSAKIPDIRFSDIAGLTDVKRAVEVRMIYPMKYPEKYDAYGKKRGGGLLLYGPPGTGKTMIAKAIACEVGAKFFSIKGSDIVSKWVGDSERNINALFEAANREPLAIIFIDEMDSLVASRGSDSHNDKRVNEFLQQIDGFAGKNPNLLLLGATNRPWDIDNAAIRSGRFSQKVYVTLPDGSARRFLLKRSMKGVPGENGLDFEKLTELTAGYSGADIEELCDRAKEEPLLKSLKQETNRVVTNTDFMRALRAVPPTVSEKEVREFEKYAGTGVKNSSMPEEVIEIEEASVAELQEKKQELPEDRLIENREEENEYDFEWDVLPSISFSDVAGLADVKDAVRRKVLLPMKNPEAFEGYVKKNGGGLLLYGPPGTGKTMIAAAIAREIGAKFCTVGPSDLLHQGVGNSEKAVRALFAQARKFPCSVIFFDEIDSISPKSTKSQYAKQLRSEFLRQIQGIEDYGKERENVLFLIAATNKPWEIDSAFMRPGRFGVRIYVGLPDSDARLYLIQNRLEKIVGKGVVKCDLELDLSWVIEATDGFNGSDLSLLLDEVQEISIERAFAGAEKEIRKSDFEVALARAKPSVQTDDLINLRNWKEHRV